MSDFLSRSRAVARRATQAGELQMYSTERRLVPRGEIWFQVLLKSLGFVSSKPTYIEGEKRNPSARKRRIVTGVKTDVFRPYQEDMFVQNVGESHVLLLNKFPVFVDHLLLITREFAPQTQNLCRSDFDAVFSLFEDLGDDRDNWVCFYNRGKLSGCSVPHKHFQLARLKEFDNSVRFPAYEALISNGGPHVPIRHYFQLFGSEEGTRMEDCGYERYLDALAHVGIPSSTEVTPATPGAENSVSVCCPLESGDELHHVDLSVESYNFLMTSRFLYVIPRRHEHFHSKISCNALTFLNCVYIQKAEYLDIDFRELLSWIAFPLSEE